MDGPMIIQSRFHICIHFNAFPVGYLCVYMTKLNNSKQVTTGLATISFFLCLVAWSLSSPISSAPDSDYHMSGIWCAWGSKPGICENQKTGPTGATAVVTYFVQICEDRPITEFRNCDLVDEHPAMQTLRTSDGSAKNLYYILMRVFASTNVPLSIVIIRLVSCVLASILLFGLLSVARGRLLIGAISSITFILVPNALVLIPAVTSKSWALIGSLFSWAFLYICADKFRKNRDRVIAAAFYCLCVFLVLSTRIDATVFLIFSSTLILIRAVSIRSLFFNTKYRLLLVFSIALLLVGTRVPRVNGYLTQLKPQGHGSIPETFLYYFNQIVESFASSFGYWVPQSGAGPGAAGIIGLSLATFVIGVSLQGQNRQQLLQATWVVLFVSALIYWGNLAMGPRVPGTYILSLTAFLIGLTVVNANVGPHFMLASTSRIFVISIISISHWIVLEGRINGFLEPSPPGNKYAPWLDLSNAPVLILIIGFSSFAVFLHTLWKLIDLDQLSSHASELKS
jgi:hypothetical protein